MWNISVLLLTKEKFKSEPLANQDFIFCGSGASVFLPDFIKFCIDSCICVQRVEGCENTVIENKTNMDHSLPR